MNRKKWQSITFTQLTQKPLNISLDIYQKLFLQLLSKFATIKNKTTPTKLTLLKRGPDSNF